MSIAPALSTAQDEHIFRYNKVKSAVKPRPYLQDSKNLFQSLHKYYNVSQIIDFISQKDDEDNYKYKRTTLQFPDALVQDAAIVLQLIQKDLDEQLTVWILADTSYSPCCVDEVAAEHVNADLVVHFGDSCLNPVSKIPALYVFGQPYLDHSKIVESFRETFTSEERIVIMSDCSYDFHLNDIYSTLSREFSNLGVAHIDYDMLAENQFVDRASPLDFPLDFPSVKAVNKVVYGVSDSEDDLQNYKLFHISMPEPPRLLELSTRFSDITVFDPITAQVSQGPYPSLMKRYKYMHVARTACTIGILVNTLSLANTRTLLNTVAKWIKDAGKKHYMFVVGKPNVAKLANFDVIDVWVILGCGQSGIIVDQMGEYYKPIITPYELQMALQPEVSWTGKWVTGFKDVLALGDDIEHSQSTEPEFDAVNGRYVSSRPLRQLNHLEIEVSSSDTLTTRFAQQVAIKDTVSTSAEMLQTRHWAGLGTDYGSQEVDEEGAVVEEGIGGTARDYGEM